MWKKVIVVFLVIACVASTAIEEDLAELKEEAKAAKEERDTLKLKLRHHDYAFVAFGSSLALLVVIYVNCKCAKCAQQSGQQSGQQIGACFLNAEHSNKSLGVSFHQSIVTSSIQFLLSTFRHTQHSKVDTI